MCVDLSMLGWYPHHRNVSVRMSGVDTGLRVTELRDTAEVHRTNPVLPAFIPAKNRLYCTT
jgi:hypothetical protein